MRYVVKYEVNEYRIYNAEGKLICRIHRSIVSGNGLLICDRTGKGVCRIIRGDGEIFVEKEGKESVYCAMEYPMEEGKVGKPVIRQAFTRPPLAEKIVLQTKNGTYTLRQMKNREFLIWRDGKMVGRMTHMLRINKRMELSEQIPEMHCGVLFALGFLMLHEDDIEIV